MNIPVDGWSKGDVIIFSWIKKHADNEIFCEKNRSWNKVWNEWDISVMNKTKFVDLQQWVISVDGRNKHANLLFFNLLSLKP